MKSWIMKTGAMLIVMSLVSLSPGCVTTGKKDTAAFEKPSRSAAEYENAGRYWGNRLWNQGTKPSTPVDEAFVGSLAGTDIDYFTIHADLKQAFQKGFRMGYEDRIADLVLGPHVTAAAAQIGRDTSQKFVDTVSIFETGWTNCLVHAVDVFIILISEGSQADRERFISEFTSIYSEKYSDTQRILKSRGVLEQTSEGGTKMYINMTKGKALGALDIPSPPALKTEIYHQTFKVMGDEWGRRYATNLIKREELIELLRKIKPALKEVEGNNLEIIATAFMGSYGTDGDNIFSGVLAEAGYAVPPKVIVKDAVYPEPAKGKPQQLKKK